MKNVIKHWFTGPDNQTWDVGRVLWAAVVIEFMALAAYALYKGQAFDAVAYGTGAGLVLAGGGVAIGMKANSEPKP